MKTRNLLLIVLLPLFAIQCKKNEAPKDYPCLGHFSCDINGKHFVANGKWGCPSKKLWYDRVSGDLSISGIDCSAELGDPLGVSCYMFGIFQTGEYYSNVWKSSVWLQDTVLGSAYDSILSGKINLTTFVTENYSAEWTNGVVAGTFECTLWNSTLNDTVHITNGDFCMRMY